MQKKDFLEISMREGIPKSNAIIIDIISSQKNDISE